MNTLKLTSTRRSRIVGGIFSVLSLVLVIIYAGDYSNVPVWGHLLVVIALLMGVLVFPAMAWKPCNKTKFYPLYYAFIFFLSPFLLETMVELLNGNFVFHLKNLCYIDNYCMFLLAYFILYILTGSLRITSFVLSPLFFAFGVINMYVKEFKGGPLVPMDIGSIATAATVAKGYTYTIGMEVSFAAVITLLVIALSSRLDVPEKFSKKFRYSLRGILLAIVLILSGLFYGTDVFVKLGYKPDFFNQMRGYQNTGALLNFIENTRYLKQDPPEGYDPDSLESDLNRLIVNTPPSSSSSGSPDIIVIMNESFADLRVIGDFETDRDFMPFTDSLTENTIKGYAYTPTFGSGTSNTEFEFLTGNSMSFFQSGSNAYQLYVRDKLPGLTETLKDQGYSATAMHPYFRANWNREKVYDLMGFDKYYGFEDLFDSVDTAEYINNSSNYFMFNSELEDKYKFKNVLLRKYVSDAYDYRLLTDLYEKRDASKPYFMFNVTMQNHSPYNLMLPESSQKVHLKGLKGTYPQTEQYLDIIRESDKAFKSLVDYYSKVDRPVIILMFGDHQPFVEDEFYAEVMGKPVNELSDEELMKRYLTNFVIWANYDIEEQEDITVSTNYLSCLLADAAGIKMPEYNTFLNQLKKDVPVITPFGCFDRNGRYFKAEEDNRYEDLISLYSKLSYNNCIDSKNMINDVFLLP